MGIVGMACLASEHGSLATHSAASPCHPPSRLSRVGLCWLWVCGRQARWVGRAVQEGQAGLVGWACMAAKDPRGSTELAGQVAWAERSESHGRTARRRHRPHHLHYH